MPSRCANTGTRASVCTRATRLLPPRGTITSRAPSSPASMAPTAARSRVGTSWTAAAGNSAACKPSRIASAIAAAAETLGPSPQDGGVAGLKAERPRVRRHVRTALEYDADDPQRRRHPLDHEAVRTLEGSQDPSDWIG